VRGFPGLQRDPIDFDLVCALTVVLNSLCARLYGYHAATDRVRHAVEVVTQADEPA
jgi:predicted site-specific integrase-resolvase